MYSTALPGYTTGYIDPEQFIAGTETTSTEAPQELESGYIPDGVFTTKAPVAQILDLETPDDDMTETSESLFTTWLPEYPTSYVDQELFVADSHSSQFHAPTKTFHMDLIPSKSRHPDPDNRITDAPAIMDAASAEPSDLHSTIGNTQLDSFIPLPGIPLDETQEADTRPSSLEGYQKVTKTFLSTMLITEAVVQTSFVETTNSVGEVTTVPVAFTSTTVKPLVTQVAVSGFEAKWEQKNTFIGSYLPIMIATILEIIWMAIFAKVKLVSPFIAMSRPHGAAGKDSLFPYYLNSNLTPTAISAFLGGHWPMLFASIAYAVVSFLPAIASESLFADTFYCSNPNPNKPLNPCFPPRLSVDPFIVRLLQALLGFLAVMALGIALLLTRLPSGIFADPSSIIGVATLARHPTLASEFNAMHTDATMGDLKSHIGSKRFALRDHQTTDGTWRYGIVQLDQYGDVLEKSPKYQHDQHKTPQAYSPYAEFPTIDPQPLLSTPNYLPTSSKRNHRLSARKTLAVQTTLFMVFLLGVLGIVTAYYIDKSNSAFNIFFSSNSFGPRFIMTLTGTIISLHLRRLQRRKPVAPSITQHFIIANTRGRHPSSNALSRPLLVKKALTKLGTPHSPNPLPPRPLHPPPTPRRSIHPRPRLPCNIPLRRPRHSALWNSPSKRPITQRISNVYFSLHGHPRLNPAIASSVVDRMGQASTRFEVGM